MGAPTILWLIPKWTFPIVDGARVATDKLIRNMAQEGAVIDVACLGLQGDREKTENDNELKRRWKIRNVYYRPRNIPALKWQKIAYYSSKLLTSPLTPLTMSSFRDPATVSFVAGLVEHRHYDWILLDGLHLGACFFDGKKFHKPRNAGKVLYRAHNIESDLWTGAIERSRTPIGKSFFRFQKSLVEKFERGIIRGSDMIAPISKEDNEWIVSKFPGKPVNLTVLGMDFSRPFKFVNKSTFHFLFLGRLDWPPNKDGLAWFLDNVWPFVDTDNKHLHVAGSGDGKWLDKYKGLKSSTFHGFVQDIEPLYLKCDATVAPIFYGSGTRIKVIESYAKGRAVITTKMGAQGSGLTPQKDYFEATSADEWIRQLNMFSLEKAEDTAIAGRKKLMNSFEEKAVARQLYHKML